jgi:hypothetical protein
MASAVIHDCYTCTSNLTGPRHQSQSSFIFRTCAVLVNGGRRLLVFSGQSVAVPIPGPAVIDVILTFLLSGVLLGLLQLLRQR